MPERWTKINIDEVEDAAPGNGLGERWEARVARESLDSRRTGLTHFRLRPGRRKSPSRPTPPSWQVLP